MKRSTKKVIALDTLDVVEKGFYINSLGAKIDFFAIQQAAEKNTILYTPTDLESLVVDTSYLTGKFQTKFIVNGLTTLDAVRQEFEADKNVVCLNFASARNPGGGFLNGSEAQEESIARASGLYNCQLKAEAYYTSNRASESCLYTHHLIYSPNVPILKDEEGEFLQDLVYTSIITAPAVNTGVVLRNEPQNIDKILPVMKERMDMVLALCKKHGHQTLILGAWGCGVFGNDPKTIADLFKELLTTKYANQFEKVVFAVYSKNERFVRPFVENFG